MGEIFQYTSLREDELDELIENTVFDEYEIELLYVRFKYLDRSNTCLLTFAELQMVPEFDGNPFSSLILYYIENNPSYGCLNFACFVDFLSIFSEKTEKVRRIAFLFDLFDLEQNGKLTRSVLERIYGILHASSKGQPDDEGRGMVDRVLRLYDKGRKGYLSRGDFTRLYCDDDTLEKNMLIDFSREIRKERAQTFWDFVWPSNE